MVRVNNGKVANKRSHAQNHWLRHESSLYPWQWLSRSHLPARLSNRVQLQELSFEREKKMQIYYREIHIGTRRVDFFVENAVMVELKAVEKIEDVHKAQAINYCEAYNIADGLLINFGGKSLEFKRVYNKKLVTPNPVHPVIQQSCPDNDLSDLKR